MIVASATVLYPHGTLQAQMQTKSFSYNKENKSADKKTKLFVPQDKEAEKPSAQKSQDITSQEIDRIFAKYKSISDKQDQAAAAKPIKDKTLSKGAEKNTDKTEEQPEKGGFSGILEQYEKNKANKSKTNSIRFKTPDNFNK